MEFSENILNNELCFQLYVASKEIVKLYKPLLDTYHLTYTDFITLLALKDEMTVNDLGKILFLDSGTLSPLLKKLEKQDLILRKRSLLDERKVCVSLTPKGTLIREKLPCVSQKVYEDNLEKHPIDYLSLLLELRKLNTLFQKK